MVIANTEDEDPMSETTESIAAIVESVAKTSEVWAHTPYAERARVIRAIADGIDADSERLIRLAQEETNLPEGRLVGEVKRTTFQLRLFAEVLDSGEFLDARIDRPDAEWPMGAPRPDLRRMLIPIGPVLVFSASNFPFAFSVAGGDTAAALAAGNAVLVKAHSGHPKLSAATGEVITAAVAAAGGPENLLRVISGTQNGVEALKHPAIKAASFTGSIPGGRALFDIANARPEPIPFYGELGSVNPTFVFPEKSEARAADIAAGFLGAITGSQGQLCTKPGLLFVPKGSAIFSELEKITAPPASKMLNDRIQAGYADSLTALQGHADVTPLYSDEAGLTDPPSVSILTTTIEAMLADPETLTAEVFGPTGLVIGYNSTDEFTPFARGLEGQLTATIFAEESEAEAIRPLVAVLQEKAGRLLWNQWPTGLSVTYAQQHGGPYPATTAPGTTAVGTASIGRFLRPVAFQNFPQALLPEPLQDANPLGYPQRIDG